MPQKAKIKRKKYPPQNTYSTEKLTSKRTEGCTKKSQKSENKGQKTLGQIKSVNNVQNTPKQRKKRQK